MVDIVDVKTRSRMMSGIHSKNTAPEIITRKFLHGLGYRFKLDSKVGKIKPDIVLRRYRVAIFTHGCYWHQHEGCKLAYSDKRYSDKWKKKFYDNRQRDDRVLEQLLNDNWRVAIIWECSTRDRVVFENAINQLHNWVQGNVDRFFESDFKKVRNH